MGRSRMGGLRALMLSVHALCAPTVRALDEPPVATSQVQIAPSLLEAGRVDPSTLLYNHAACGGTLVLPSMWSVKACAYAMRGRHGRGLPAISFDNATHLCIGCTLEEVEARKPHASYAIWDAAAIVPQLPWPPPSPALHMQPRSPPTPPTPPPPPSPPPGQPPTDPPRAPPPSSSPSPPPAPANPPTSSAPQPRPSPPLAAPSQPPLSPQASPHVAHASSTDDVARIPLLNGSAPQPELQPRAPPQREQPPPRQSKAGLIVAGGIALVLVVCVCAVILAARARAAAVATRSLGASVDDGGEAARQSHAQPLSKAAQQKPGAGQPWRSKPAPPTQRAAADSVDGQARRVMQHRAAPPPPRQPGPASGSARRGGPSTSVKLGARSTAPDMH